MVRKFRYSKAKPVAGDWAAYSATVLHQFVEERLARGLTVAERRLCRFVDVFAGRVFEAPEAFKDRRKEIEAACWEIKQLWPTIEAGVVAKEAMPAKSNNPVRSARSLASGIRVMPIGTA
jgi:hypothetical protein